MLPYTGNIWPGNFWQTTQVKAIGEEKFGKKLQSVHMPNIFSMYAKYIFNVSANIGKENYSE